VTDPRILAIVTVASLTACMPPYRPPSADQPHAVLKLRRSYDQVAGAALSESVDVDEHDALRTSTYANVASAARTDSILVHPVPATFSFSSDFFHTEQQMVHESYQEAHTTYVTETYGCTSGFGTNQTYSTCTRTVPHTSYETKYRDVLRTVQVSDGSCSVALRFAPQDGHIYLLQYTYHRASICDLSCFEQIPGEGGTFQNRPCPAG